MEIRLEGFDRLQRAFMQSPQLVHREIESWMLAQGNHLQREVQRRTPKDTGALQKSIANYIVPAGPLGVEAIITTPLNYAQPVEFGAKPHDISPKNGKFLHFMMRGVPVFARKVHHPGSKGAFMFEKAFNANATQIQQDFIRLVDHILAKIATGAV